MRRWKNRVAARIPSSVPRASHLVLHEMVYVRKEASRIVIEPVRQKVYDLTGLLKAITPKNQHQAADFGALVGNEGAGLERRERKARS